MRVLTAIFALGVVLVAGRGLALANAELEFPDADENGPDHLAPVEQSPRLLAAPVVVRHLPMARTSAPAVKPTAPAMSAPAPSPGELEFPDADENGP